jgi:hypothetical protein
MVEKMEIESLFTADEPEFAISAKSATTFKQIIVEDGLKIIC